MKKIAIIFSILLSGVSFSFAQTAGDIDPNGITQTEPQCTILKSTNLRYLSTDKNTNNEVYALQMFLVDQGYLNAEPVDPTVDPNVFNTFRKGTLSAVKAFQKDNGLLASGYVGNLTKAKIQSISCNGSTQTSPTQPPVSTTSTPSASVIGTPTLNRQYDLFNKEVSLTGRATFTVNAGNGDLYIFNRAGNLQFIDKTGKSTYTNSYKSSEMTMVSGNASLVTDSVGNNMYKIPQGQRAVFSVSSSMNPKQMFAGVYTVSLQNLSGYRDINGVSTGVGYLNIDVSPNQSQPVTIVGETSPYMSSVTTDANGLVRISGARLNLPDNRWFVDGRQEIAQVKGDATSASFNPVNFNLSAGSHTLQIKNLQTGDSNSWSFNVTTGTQTTNTPTVEFLGTPSISIQYDSAGKESILYGKAYVKITTGNSQVSLYQNSIPGMLQFISNTTGTTYSNGMKFVSIVAQGSMTPLPTVGGVLIIPANSSMTFVITNSAPTKELFAGTYYMGLAGLQYGDTNNNSQTVQPSAFINGFQSNSVTIVGETSPYMSSVTTDANGLVRISGARLNLPDNRWFVDGRQEIAQVKGDATSASFNPVNFNLSAGSHTLQIKNLQTGDSNSWSFNVTTGTQTTNTPTVEFTGYTPFLRLTYDSAGKEAMLTISAEVKITTGNIPITLYQNSIPGILQFNRNGTDAVYSNNMAFHAVQSNKSPSVEVKSGDIIPANTSATFLITNNALAKELFSGSYSISLSGFRYNDSNGNYQTVQPSAFINGFQSNSVTIVGETSPYMSSVTTDANGLVRISGARLNLPDNRWFVDGRQEIAQVKGDATSASFNPVNFNLSAGSHTLQIKNLQTGDSNYIVFSVSSSTVAKPSAIFSVTPTTVQSGGSVTATWKSANATNCIATSSPYLPSWSSPSIGLSGSKVITGVTAPTTFILACSNGQLGGGADTYQSASVGISYSTAGAPSIARTAGFTAQTVSPNSIQVKIGSFTIQAPTTNGVMVYSTTPTFYVSGYTLDNLINVSLRSTNSSGVESLLGVPIVRLTNNSPVFTFPDILVEAGQTRRFDVYADIGNAQSGSVTTAMSVGYRTANIGIDGAVRADGVPVTSAVSTGFTATLNPVSPASQFVVGGSSFGIGTFRLSTQGAGTTGTVRELQFTTTGQNAIASITANGVTNSVMQGSVTTITGLNIPVSNIGTDIIATVQLSGFQNSTTGGSLTSPVSPVYITLTKVSGVSGNGSPIQSTVSASSNQITLVASKPTLTMGSGVTSPLVLGTENKIGEFTVTADANGKIGLQSFTLATSIAGISNPSYSNVRLVDSGTTVSSASISLSGTNINVSFPLFPYEIQAGTSKTFSVMATVNGALVSGTDPVIYTQFGAPSLFVWKDIVTNSTQTGTTLINYPTNAYRLAGSANVSPTVTPVLNLTVSGTSIPSTSADISVAPGTPLTFNWSGGTGVYNCFGFEGSGEWYGYKTNPSGSLTVVSPTKLTKYRLSCAFNTASPVTIEKAIVVTPTIPQPQTISGVNKAVDITFKNVASTSMDIVATFNTTIPNTQIFAIYGTDRNLSASNCIPPTCLKTKLLSASSNGVDTPYTFSVNGLTPNTTVAYKAYAQDPNGNLVEGTWVTQAIIIPTGIVATCADADVNGDGIIDTNDAYYVSNLSGKSVGVAGYEAKADMDKSGTINSGDILKIKGLVSTCPQPATGVASKPSAPTNVSYAAGDGSITATFSAPANTGTSPITLYVLDCKTGVTFGGTSSPLKLTGLTNGNTYNCSVYAVNSVGSGVPSTPSSVTLPPVMSSQLIITPPAPTPIPTKTATPVGNGAYTVLSPNGGEVFKIGGTMTIKWKVTGLTTGNNSIALQVHDNSAPYKSLYTGYVSNPVVNDEVVPEGSQTITIPANTTPGMYTVYISGATGWDESDAYFTVNGTGVATENTPYPIKVLTASVKNLEQIYTKYVLGGAPSASASLIPLSAPITISGATSVTSLPSVSVNTDTLAQTTEVINFVGLKRGSAEARVSSLKAVLRSISPTVSIGCHNLNVANILYGPTTEECVRIFQNLNELEPTGIIDEVTNKALNKVITTE